MQAIFPLLMIIILITSNLTFSIRYFADYDNPIFRERFSQFNCYKFRICTRGAPRVCGYNPYTQEMDEFEDKCAIYLKNCKEQEFYKQIDMSRCVAKKAFLTVHNESLKFEHVLWPNRRTTTGMNSNTTTKIDVPGLVRLVHIQ